MLTNTPPTIDFLPTDISMNAGETYTLLFGKPNDSEGNAVAVDSFNSVGVESSDKSFDDWFTLKNDTIIEKVTLEIRVPSDAITEDIELNIQFKDDHRFSPAKISVTVLVKVSGVE